MTQEELRIRDLTVTGTYLKWAVLGGLAFIVSRYVSLIVASRQVSGQLFIALLWAAAWFAAGFLLGFIFGIPRVPDYAKQGAGGTAGRTDTTGDTGTKEGAKSTPYQLRVNTNLEEISDWLTKILVGATLTQLVKVPTQLKAAAEFMSHELGAPASVTFAAAIIVYFSAVGFFAGYVLTRMFFAGAFVRSDQLTEPDIGALATARTTLESSPSDPNAVAAAQKTRDIPITDSLPADVAAATLAGALLTNDMTRAVQAGKVAVEKKPDDPRVHLNYAIALHWNNPTANESLVQSELERALGIVSGKYDAPVIEDIYNSAMYFYLYVEPDGFKKTIEYGERYLAGNNVPSRPSIWTNLACGYGQQYESMKLSRAPEEELAAVAKKVMNAVERALAINPASARRFRELATGSADPQDNDLKVVAGDYPELKKLIGLT